MNELRRKALASLPLTESQVETIYVAPHMMPAIKRLCESHERLRAELAGASAVIEDMRREADALAGATLAALEKTLGMLIERGDPFSGDDHQAVQDMRAAISILKGEKP